MNLKNLQVQILFVNDGSIDNTLGIIKELAKMDKDVSYISFSRNFGKEAAMYAGMENATGNYVAIMDVDLQDPPALLGEMFTFLIHEGYDCVATKRATRKGEPFFRSLFSETFYKLINRISKTEIVNGARDYRLMTRQMVNSILTLKEYNRFSKGLFDWVGYNVKWISYDNAKRVAGQTKWSFWGLFLYSLDGIIAFSEVPLALASILGIIMFILSVIGIITILVKTILFGDPVSGWPSTITIISFIGGIQLLCMGIIGQYISKIYLEAKKRPIYIVKESSINEIE